VQKYMGDEDGVDQVKGKDDGVVALDRGQTNVLNSGLRCLAVYL
jgi:hypothetical protein